MHAVPNEVLAGKYRIARLIGEGGMGIVAEAVHLGLGHRVALKLLKTSMVRPDHRERFFREARAAGSLSSEHVVAIKDVDTLPDGTPFLVMEYLEGADLGGVVQQRGPLPIEDAADYVLQACHAVAEAHANGIVHRDLKPANLFLTRRADGAPLVKVLDFGIAKIAGPELARDLTSTSQYMGSPSYMSPEQVRSAKRVDARTDLWALGVILYELLTASLPFDGESAGDMLVKISTEPPCPFAPPVAVPGVEAIILRCLEKEPERRYRDVAELAAALAPFAGVTGRARAEAVARVAGRALPPVLPAMPAAPPLAARLPVTVTTLGSSAGSSMRSIAPSHAGASRPRSWLTIAAVALVILGGAATFGYLRVAPELRPAARPVVSPAPPPEAEAAPQAARAAAPAAPDPAPPPTADPASDPRATAVPPAPANDPRATAAPPAPPAIDPPAPDAGVADDPAHRPARKLAKPGRRAGSPPGKPGSDDGSFIEDRR